MQMKESLTDKGNIYTIKDEHFVYFTCSLFKVYTVTGLLPGCCPMHVELKCHQEFLFVSGLLFHSASYIDHRFHTWVPFIFKRNIPWTLCKASLVWSFAICKIVSIFPGFGQTCLAISTWFMYLYHSFWLSRSFSSFSHLFFSILQNFLLQSSVLW